MKAVLRSSYEEIVEGFSEDCRLRGLTEKTTKNYQAIVQLFLDLLDDRETSLHEVDLNTLRHFLAYLKDERKLAHKTIKSYFTALSTFYDYLVIEEQAQNNIIPPLPTEGPTGF